MKGLIAYNEMDVDVTGQRQRRQPAAQRLLASLLAQRPRLRGRFLQIYHHLRGLPRQTRRQLERKAALGLAGAALILALSRVPASAANITVVANEVIVSDNGKCSLIEAIQNANDTADGSVHDDCATGNPNGADTINLPAGKNFGLGSPFANYYESDTGLPLITSKLTINGNGSTIIRTDSENDFRLLAVNNSGDLALNDLTLRDGRAQDGGAIFNHYGEVALNNTKILNNSADRFGGGIYNYAGALTITNSTISGNSAAKGGGLYNYFGAATISNSTISGNTSSVQGGGAYVHFTDLIITSSTLSGNTSYNGGGLFNEGSEVIVVNSTFSGNTASSRGGGIYNYVTDLTIVNSTLTGNSATSNGGGVRDVYGTLIFERSLFSGNNAPGGPEVSTYNGDVDSNNFNLFGKNGNAGVTGFEPGAKDIVPDQPLTGILSTTLASNGGPTKTHALVPGSPAIDAAPSNACTAAPVSGKDQRNKSRNVNGKGGTSNKECDIGTFERRLSDFAVGSWFAAATTSGQTADGVSFSPVDILFFNGSGWTRFFDGRAAGLDPNLHINAFAIPDPVAGAPIYLTLAETRAMVPSVGAADGTDVVHYQGGRFSQFFDGADVGLTTVGEKIDGLDVVPGPVMRQGQSCQAYLLISTQGAGRVTGSDGQGLKFSGEDVLGFCATGVGSNTSGAWFLELDGSAEGMPRNSTVGLAASDDLQTLFLTTKGVFQVDEASGRDSMVYRFDAETGQFSGPIFDARAAGLPGGIAGLETGNAAP